MFLSSHFWMTESKQLVSASFQECEAPLKCPLDVSQGVPHPTDLPISTTSSKSSNDLHCRTSWKSLLQQLPFYPAKIPRRKLPKVETNQNNQRPPTGVRSQRKQKPKGRSFQQTSASSSKKLQAKNQPTTSITSFRLSPFDDTKPARTLLCKQTQTQGTKGSLPLPLPRCWILSISPPQHSNATAKPGASKWTCSLRCSVKAQRLLQHHQHHQKEARSCPVGRVDFGIVTQGGGGNMGMNEMVRLGPYCKLGDGGGALSLRCPGRGMDYGTWGVCCCCCLHRALLVMVLPNPCLSSYWPPSNIIIIIIFLWFHAPSWEH